MRLDKRQTFPRLQHIAQSLSVNASENGVNE